MSTLKVNTIRHTGASSDAITLAADGTAAIGECTANITNSVSDTNLLINPHMQINQRGSGTLTVNSSTGQYPVDRWVSRGEGGSRDFTVQQISVADQGLGVRNCVKITSSQAGTVTANDIFNFRQMIEGYNTQRLNLGESGCASMTLSFTARSSVAGTHSGAIQNSAQNKSYPFTYTLAANTWADIKITIPPITSGSFNEENGVGLRVIFDMGSGDNFRGTANQWNSAHDEGATGAVRILETNGATWEITKVQLEEGTIKSPTQKRSYGDELSRCKRYYFQFGGSTDETNRFIIEGYTKSTSYSLLSHIDYTMRAAPTVTKTSGWAENNVGSVSFNYRDSNQCAIRLIANANDTCCFAHTDADSYLKFDAEI